MMAFPYAGSSLTMCKTSSGKTSRVLTSLRKMSLGVVLSTGSFSLATLSSKNLSKLIITRIISLRNGSGPFRVGLRRVQRRRSGVITDVTRSLGTDYYLLDELFTDGSV